MGMLISIMMGILMGSLMGKKERKKERFILRSDVRLDNADRHNLAWSSLEHVKVMHKNNYLKIGCCSSIFFFACLFINPCMYGMADVFNLLVLDFVTIKFSVNLLFYFFSAWKYVFYF